MSINSIKAVIRIERVKQELLAGTLRKDMLEKLSKEFGVTKHTIEKAIPYANRDLEKEIADKRIQAYVLQEEFKRKEREAIVTDERVDCLLSEIINGNRKEEKIINTVKGAEVVQANISTADLLRAISLYFVRRKLMKGEEEPEWAMDVKSLIDGIPWEEHGKGKEYRDEYRQLNIKYGLWKEEFDNPDLKRK